MADRPKWGSSGGAWQVSAADVPPEIDVAAIRKREGVCQAAFAKRYGFTLGAVKDWEQKRRRPGRAARILLTLIEREPKAVERVLGVGPSPALRRRARPHTGLTGTRALLFGDG